MSFLYRKHNFAGYWVVPRWERIGVVHGFVGRDINVKDSYGQWNDGFGDFAQLRLLSQVHGTDIVQIDTPGRFSEDGQEFFKRPKGDAWISSVLCESEKDICIGVMSADCFPVLIRDRSNCICAAIHCGWRSTVAGLLRKTVLKILSSGSSVEDLELAIGPGAMKCCYQVGDDVVAAFCKLESGASFINSNSNGQSIVDIPGLISSEIMSLGVAEDSIFRANLCTICDERFFSYRREKLLSGRQVSFISNVLR